MDEVVQALEGAIAPMECFVHDHTERVLCSHEPDAGRGCATKLLWTRVQAGIVRSLQTTTLAELVEFSHRTDRVPATPAGAQAPAVSATAVGRRRPPLRHERKLEMADLEIRNLHVQAGDKEILRGLDLSVSKGEIHALMGPNGSGKSTLANAIMGHPNLDVTEGQILFKGEDITEADTDERARMGLFMAFQYPVSVPGVTVTKYLRTVMNAHREAHGEEPIPLKRLPPDGRGGDEADQRAQGVLEPLPQRRLLRRREEAHGDPAARAPASRAGDPRRDRLRPGHRRAAGRRQRRQLGRRPRHGRADHHPLPADPAPRAAQPRARHLPGADRQGRRPGPRRRARGQGLRVDHRPGRAHDRARGRHRGPVRHRFAVPGPEPADRRQADHVSRLGRNLTDAAAGDRRDDQLLHGVSRLDPPRRVPARRRGDRPVRGRARPNRRLARLDARGDDLLGQRDRRDQPRRLQLGTPERPPWRPRGADRDGAPLQHRPLAAALPGPGGRACLRARARRRAARPRRARRAAGPRAQARELLCTSRTCWARSTPSTRSCAERTRREPSS